LHVDLWSDHLREIILFFGSLQKDNKPISMKKLFIMALSLKWHLCASARAFRQNYKQKEDIFFLSLFSSLFFSLRCSPTSSCGEEEKKKKNKKKDL